MSHKVLFSLSLMCLLCFGVQAQKQPNPCAAILLEDGSTPSNSRAVLVEPQFKGGESKLYKFLAENVKYPEMAIEQNITGTVVVKFVVEKDGSITNIEIAKSVAAYLDNECIRVVKKMPRWKPGTADGEPVRFSYCLPVQFNLE